MNWTDKEQGILNSLKKHIDEFDGDKDQFREICRKFLYDLKKSDPVRISKSLAKNSAYRRTHRKELKEYYKQYRKDHPEYDRRVKEKLSNWRQRNKDKCRSYNRKSYHKMKYGVTEKQIVEDDLVIHEKMHKLNDELANDVKKMLRGEI